MGIAERLIEVLPWERYALANGAAESLAGVFRELLSSVDGRQANRIWDRGFENQIFAQDTVYSGALPALEVAFAALAEERPRHVRFFLVELVFLLVNGEGEDCELTDQIRSLAMSGWWTVVREAVHGWEAHRETALYILEALDPSHAEQIVSLLPPPTAVGDVPVRPEK